MVSHTIYPDKDTYVKETDPDSNFGGLQSMGVWISNDANTARRILIEFDLSNILDVPYDNIATCILNLNCYGVTDARTLDFRRIDNDTWTELGVTWNNQPTSSDYNVESDWTTTGWKSRSVKSLLLGALRDGHSYLGILMKWTDETADGTIDEIFFRTSEHTDKPYLTVTYDTYSQTRLKGSLCKNLLDKDGWGEITMTDHNCPSPCDAATFTFKTAWGTTYTTVLLDVGDTQQYNSGAMHHSFKLYSMAAVSVPCDNLAAATIEEKYWEDDCYVKTAGDNDRNGTSWAEAWSTVDQGANEAFDGQEVHIGFGTYNNEPANNDITPVNFSTVGIKYTPETATTGGGTGSATVERN